MEKDEITPKVGMGVTRVVGSDRYPGTITRVSPSGKTFWYRSNDFRRTDNNGLSEIQEYEYNALTYGPEVRVNKRRKGPGWKEQGGSAVVIGYRRAYLDPSF